MGIIIEIRGVVKSYPGVKALKDVSFDIQQNSVHCIVGKNGASKSTMIKLLSGAERRDSGEILFDGEPYSPRNIKEAMEAGMSVLYQELNIVDQLTVWEDLVLSKEKSRMGVIQRGDQEDRMTAILAVFVHIPFAIMVALMLSTKMRGWRFLRTAYFVPQIISSVAWAAIFISVFNPSYGLLNGVLSLVGLSDMARNWLFDPFTAWGAIICTWLFFIGMYSMIMLAELISIPEEVLQSAAIDGANLMQTAIYIKLPAMRLVTGTCMILTVTGGIRFFDGLYIMTNGAPNYRTETLALYLYQQYTYADFSYANTIGVFLLCMGMVLVSLVMWGMGTNRPHELD